MQERIGSERPAAGNSPATSASPPAGPSPPPRAGFTPSLLENLPAMGGLEEAPGSCRPRMGRGKARTENWVQVRRSGGGGGMSIPWDGCRAHAGGRGALPLREHPCPVPSVAGPSGLCRGEAAPGAVAKRRGKTLRPRGGCAGGGSQRRDGHRAVPLPARAAFAVAGFPTPPKQVSAGEEQKEPPPAPAPSWCRPFRRRRRPGPCYPKNPPPRQARTIQSHQVRPSPGVRSQGNPRRIRVRPWGWAPAPPAQSSGGRRNPRGQTPLGFPSPWRRDGPSFTDKTIAREGAAVGAGRREPKKKQTKRQFIINDFYLLKMEANIWTDTMAAL